jgi:hypothetical protein
MLFRRIYYAAEDAILVFARHGNPAVAYARGSHVGSGVAAP